MAVRRKRKGLLLTLRRGIGLGLGLVGLWGIGMMTDRTDTTEYVLNWLHEPEMVVTFFAQQLHDKTQQDTELEGWGSILVKQSGILSQGLGLIQKTEPETEQQESTPPPIEEKNEEELAPLEQDNDDESKPQLQPPEELDQVKEMTSVGTSGAQAIEKNGVYLYNKTNRTFDASLFDYGTIALEQTEGPQILILHSHGSEAYSMNDGDLYQESDPYRTTDCTHNIVRVGEEMAAVFRQQGFEVIHDTNLYDYPSYNDSYVNSKAAVKKWLEKYPSIQIILDVHRDALAGSDGTIYKLVSEEQGQKVAQTMLVVGTNVGGANHPAWCDNLALAVALQEKLMADYETLARPIVLRNSSYNQQLSPGYLLVEVGGHGNTLTEAIQGGKLFAQSVGQALKSLMNGK